MENYKNIIEKSLSHSEIGISNICDKIIKLDIMSGMRALHLYSNLSYYIKNPRYLEIGSWNGSSICSVLNNNENLKVLCIDNWDVVGGKEDFIRNIEEFKGVNEIEYLDIDYLNNVPANNSKFNIYVYNGDYLKDSNYKALVLYYNYLDNIFIYIKNDWNEEYVRDETNEAIIKLNLKVLYKKEIIIEKSIKTWRNGICIFILEK